MDSQGREAMEDVARLDVKHVLVPRVLPRVKGSDRCGRVLDAPWRPVVGILGRMRALLLVRRVQGIEHPAIAFDGGPLISLAVPRHRDPGVCRDLEVNVELCSPVGGWRAYFEKRADGA